MAETPMMGCGHAANAVRGDQPVCVICIGIVDGADEVVDAPDLMGRQSQCTYCRKVVPSRLSLPFFSMTKPGNGYDSHYDGCMGWD
jgi:hypothetical protein